jgi:hypothetical protein
MIYGNPVDPKPTAAHVLEWQIEHANRREAAILDRLEAPGGDNRVVHETLKIGPALGLDVPPTPPRTRRSTARFSTLCARPRSSSKAGGTKSGRMLHSATSRQHRRC